MASEPSEDEQFRFRVESVFTLTGRGVRVIVGYIEQGRVSIGDRLQLLRTGGESGSSGTCKAVEYVDKVSWRPGRPVTMGLIVPEFDEIEVGSGDFLIGDTTDT
ncbi:hypothetical protein VMT65_01520 [Nocardia sp. CDC153]|uniref:hypothetical protein n=1 Tax=Nocardia sp. CDC153 TaxID=3112167 RepID=UPI002DC05D9E|nr:hypothetical protein [Nocardia sp. CDC153]MEC3951701.1 hypothetical protein [Nocardia sp. CDC153]